MKKNPLKKQTGIIVRGDFSLDSAKYYIVAALIMFHILPLFFVFMGENGQVILATVFMLTLNPIFLFAVGFFYAVRNGFDFKFPLMLTVIAAASLLMYYGYGAAENAIMTLLVTGITYLILAYGSAVLGGFVKKFLM